LEQVSPIRASRCFFHASVPAIEPQAPPASSSAGKGEEDVLLVVEGLVKRYGMGRAAFTAVAGVSFEVRRGEVFGLVGESGSGKTTLARCIAGLVKKSEGRLEFDRIELGGEYRQRDRQLRRRLQMVFQNPDTALNPRHAVRRILDRALKLLGETEPQARRRQHLGMLAASVKLEPHHLEMRPRALSGGLRQRVAIARSFAGAPALVLCDEPVSALDVSVQAAILNLLVDLQTKKGVSYIFISHDLAVVRYIADRIGVMYLGQLVDVGPAEAVFNPPHHPYTEALLSAIPTLDIGGGPARIRLQGPLPNPAKPPSGCRFHTRCHRYLGDLCREREPPWQEDASGNRYRCHIEPEALRSRQ
jgi:peptide/nickel transport system ATP-binding protein